MERISLKEYLNSRIDDIKESVIVAYSAMDKRLESMNEFRDQLKDQTARFLTREEYEAKHSQLEEKIDSIQKIVWIGMGASFAIQFLLKFFIKG